MLNKLKEKLTRLLKKKDEIQIEKDTATKDGQPWVKVIKVDVDPTNPMQGHFELDWNDKFVLNLVRAGYRIKEDDTDNEIVDRWFQTVCRNVALEVYEQEVADPDKRGAGDMRVIKQRDIGNGRTEIS